MLNTFSSPGSVDETEYEERRFGVAQTDDTGLEDMIVMAPWKF